MHAGQQRFLSKHENGERKQRCWSLLLRLFCKLLTSTPYSAVSGSPDNFLPNTHSDPCKRYILLPSARFLVCYIPQGAAFE